MSTKNLKDIILESFDFAGVMGEEQEQMINELAKIAMDRTVIRALDKMSEEEVDAFASTMDNNAKPEEVFGYLENKVPSFYDMLREEVARLQVLVSNESK